MNTTAVYRLGWSVIAAAGLSVLAACAAQEPIAPNREAVLPASARVAADESASRTGQRTADLGTCDTLQVPAGSTLALHVYATGVQIYRWTGTSWTFVAPSAVLSADADGHSEVGTHYAGPTWESVSGSTVVGTVLKRCPQPNAIPWLLLGAASAEGPGIFHRVAFIQRVNTVGGNAPAAPGTVAGEIANVPYTAEYFFYRE